MLVFILPKPVQFHVSIIKALKGNRERGCTNTLVSVPRRRGLPYYATVSGTFGDQMPRSPLKMNLELPMVL